MEADAVVCGGNGVEGKRYPSPLATHEEVIKDSSLFFDTLKKFHYAFGTKFMVPVIGGQLLNLHVLYVEVTMKGGYEKVVTQKKWREVGSSFMFSPTTTSASYALRKHYFAQLYHYEQVYFFRSQDLPITSDFPSFEVPGTIDAKFDCGYLVSVNVGSEILSGVLYHPSQPCTAIVPYTPQPVGGKNSARRNRKKRGGDPNRPKPNRSGYNFFFAEKHGQLKSLYPNKEREFTKMIGEAWNNLSADERVVYQNQGLKDKERYQRELKEYKDSLKIKNSLS